MPWSRGRTQDSRSGVSFAIFAFLHILVRTSTQRIWRICIVRTIITTTLEQMSLKRHAGHRIRRNLNPVISKFFSWFSRCTVTGKNSKPSLNAVNPTCKCPLNHCKRNMPKISARDFFYFLTCRCSKFRYKDSLTYGLLLYINRKTYKSQILAHNSCLNNIIKEWFAYIFADVSYK